MTPTDATYRLNNRTLRIRRITGGAPHKLQVTLDSGAWNDAFEMEELRTEEDFQLAVLVATKVYGVNRRTGGPGCTNSMVHEIWNAMRDIAGC